MEIIAEYEYNNGMSKKKTKEDAFLQLTPEIVTYIAGLSDPVFVSRIGLAPEEDSIFYIVECGTNAWYRRYKKETPLDAEHPKEIGIISHNGFICYDLVKKEYYMFSNNKSNNASTGKCTPFFDRARDTICFIKDSYKQENEDLKKYAIVKEKIRCVDKFYKIYGLLPSTPDELDYVLNGKNLTANVIEEIFQNGDNYILEQIMTEEFQ